jgi:hypothetical protein
MKFKPTAIQISETEPFKWDLLDREDSAKALIDFVGTSTKKLNLPNDSSHRHLNFICVKKFLMNENNERAVH